MWFKYSRWIQCLQSLLKHYSYMLNSLLCSVNSFLTSTEWLHYHLPLVAFDTQVRTIWLHSPSLLRWSDALGCSLLSSSCNTTYFHSYVECIYSHSGFYCLLNKHLLLKTILHCLGSIYSLLLQKYRC